MIHDFESRLADVLGARLSAPWHGRAFVAPGPTNDANAMILVSIIQATPLDPHLTSRRLEQTPGAADPRRVVRLRCTLQCTVKSKNNISRQVQMEAVNACLYALDAPDFRNGLALAGGPQPDPGFVIHEMRLLEATVPVNPTGEAVEPSSALGPVRLRMEADGWFWPIGEAAQAGREIGEIRIRGVRLPVEVSPANPKLRVGGGPLELTLSIGVTGTLAVTAGPAEESAVSLLPFGRLALALFDAGGRPGKGSLSGGDVAVGGIHLVTLDSQGQARIQYTPPGETAVDELLVALNDGQDGLGVELGRFPLLVTGA